MKKPFMLISIMFVVALLGYTKNDIRGNGQVITPDINEIREFIEEKKTGLLYIKSPYQSRETEEAYYLGALESIAKKEKLDIYLFDASQYNDDHTKLGLMQHSRTLAFYQEGEIKTELD
ncbi:hypothetical protein J7E52_25515 [Bacillus sp. ISL-34]|uniref:hypothetical protein n=1 Tax=Bacillus sp. ISL-34 TaxID=2819121 RepID=UPI001BE7C82E|nr:hypothetical protein [Bacillus sp. ISL-34]MBT2650016.1 hypothetical protein [Bacillus sp. ISL-34]